MAFYADVSYGAMKVGAAAIAEEEVARLTKVPIFLCVCYAMYLCVCYAMYLSFYSFAMRCEMLQVFAMQRPVLA